MHRANALLGTVALFLLLGGCAAPGTISTGTLLREMTDLADLARFPAPAYTCRQFSSYDRAAVSPDEPDTWFANADVGQFLRTEETDGRAEYVMADVAGPGAIVRIWSANPKGNLRLYLDHNPMPVLEVPISDLLGGRVAEIPPPIAGERSKGWNCYFPIPYAQHCKITSDQPGFYYHVNYRTYAPDTPIITFTASDLKAYAAEIAEVAERLRAAQELGAAARPLSDEQQASEGRRAECRSADGTHRLDSLGRCELLGLRSWGGGALVGLRFKVDAPNVDHALRHLMLTLSFDGEQTVACPLGDFFGAGPGINPYASLPMGVTEEGELWCDWIMPFRRTARVGLQNLGEHAVTLQWEVLSAESHPWTRRSLHFHAGWRAEYEVPTRPMRDWEYLAVEGKGVFVGAAFSIGNPVRTWWGEGDEKIYVDGESFPSHFGTGTEDYYGYAWCSNERFSHAYHNQPRCDGPGNYGYTAVNRWHVLDRIPFTRSFKFDMELWHWDAECLVSPAVVTYWYARPGARSDLTVPECDDLRLKVFPPYVAPRVAGALEGEEMDIVAYSGNPGPQEIMGCSNETHLWWREAKPGEHMTLVFVVPDAGRFRVFLRCVKARDYGIIQFLLNGQPAGAPVDFYHDGVIAADEFELGVYDLQAGANELTAEIAGANEQAVKGYMFGLDYLRLERVN